MMGVFLLAAALAADADPVLLDVRMAEVDQRPAVQLLSSAPLGEVALTREPGHIVLSFQARGPQVLPQPVVAPPVQEARLSRSGPRLELRLGLPPDVSYDLRREGTVLQLVFNKPAPPPSAGDVRALYPRLFPVGTDPVVSPLDEPAAAGAEQQKDGLALGPAVVRPSLDLLYVNGEGSLQLDRSVNQEAYLEIRPRLAGEMPLGNGALTADYQLRLRAASDLPEVRHPTHLLTAGLVFPMGQQVTLRVREHYSRGTLEATEVDPGREYFFRLARFRRNTVTAGVQVETASRLKLDLAGTLSSVSLDDPSGFFDYQQRSGQVGLVYDVNQSLSAGLTYVREHVPASPERPVVATDGDTLQLSLQGTLTPLLSAQVGVGYTSQESPLAAEAGRRFRGLTADARLTQELGRSTSASLSAQRATQLSAFEGNAFYVTSSLRAEANAAGPFELVLRAGTGVRWNGYRLPASELGVPRSDRIVDWSFGGGRALGRRAFVRADYTRERRFSNLGALQTRNWSVVAQLGLGWLESAGKE